MKVGSRHILVSQNADNSGRLQGCAGVNGYDFGVGMGRAEKPGKQELLAEEVLPVFRFAGYLGNCVQAQCLGAHRFGLFAHSHSAATLGLHAFITCRTSLNLRILNDLRKPKTFTTKARRREESRSIS